MQVVGDVKCYHCGHVSGQMEGTRGTKLVLKKFTPRPGFQGTLPGPGARLRCERCSGPVYLEEIRPALAGVEPIPMATLRPARKKRPPAKPKAA